MRTVVSLAGVAAFSALIAPITSGQVPTKTLVAVWAHADDEAPVAPILARYAREGVRVHMIIATDGAQGAANTSVPRGPEIARLRAEEARCSAQALGVQPPTMSCHKTQYPQEAVERVIAAMREGWKGELPLTSMAPQAAVKDLFE